MKMFCPATTPPHEVKVKPRRDVPGIYYDPREMFCEKHGVPLKLASQLKSRKPLRRVSEKKATESPSRSTLRRGRGFAASPEQRKKIRNRACIICGQCSGFDIGDGGGSFVVDPAHVWARGLGGCDSADCVTSLCRAHHRLFDEGKLDILPALISHGCWVELAHPILCHEVSPTQLLERLTGEKWAPVERVAA